MADDNVRVHDPTSRAQDKDYDQSDVEHLVRVRDWHDWDELLDWLRREGDDDKRLTPGEVRALVRDAERARDRRAPFSLDVDRLWTELRAG
jgi:hypothetical protein